MISDAQLTLVALALAAVCGCERSSRPSLPARTSKPDAGMVRGATDSAVRMPTGDAAPATSDCDAPPPMLLMSEAGLQRGDQGSYCILCAHTGLCRDSVEPLPHQFTVVHPGDAVTFSMPGGKLLQDSPMCHPSCPPELEIGPPGCGTAVKDTKPFVEDEPWRVDVPEGTYVVVAFATFDGDDGSHGDTSVGFGLIVDPKRARALLDASWMGCVPSLEGVDAGSSH